ncbi:PREDICTED: N-terminal EF-hand calcium-binding protein 3 isoform X1 [Nanorana parkeri]|uniref:N-terminal EF-hand calcium-binding protein 3 isoform X1 n=1 Tax=Nanorana parkeri TaxID=125878 RepID=UPI000854286A|nr:PREDICTED: N-terminal EF-hand calcium-binding protein 3 isoform X1 [Nanorana parkeri]
MMSCTELITMCLLSAKHFNKDQPLTAPPEIAKQDLSIFRDIFRRADKNDDGKLSFEEFQTYFSDGVLNQEELRKMFIRIDSQQTNNMDTERICDYFSEYLGEYKNVLSALQNLNGTILTAMDKTKTNYENASQTEQFVTRFLLRETMNQLHSLQSSMECALEAIEAQAGRERQDGKQSEPKQAGRRCARRSHKSVCSLSTDAYSGILANGQSAEGETQWSIQINRLEQLIDKLECTSPRLQPGQADVNSSTTQMFILVAQRQLPVAEVRLDQFEASLRSYKEFTATQDQCLHVSVQKLQSQPGYTLYEIWEGEDSWKSHLQSVQSKAFQRASIDCLEGPEEIKTMLFPASWWVFES